MNTHRNHPNPRRGEKGQSLVEVAISLTVILMLLAGMFDLSFAFFDYIELRDAVQEGATYGSINPTDISGIVTRIHQSASAPVNFATDANLGVPEITITGNACTGGAITVSVTYNYHILMPLLGGILGTQTIPLQAFVTHTILQPICP